MEAPRSSRASTRTEDVINRLRESVLEGVLAPGSHLHEETLAQTMGVSRTPIRDALRVLANEQLLVYSPNRGYVVRRFGIDDILGAYDVRGTLEGMACRLAAERGLSAGARDALRRILERSAVLLHGAKWETAEQAGWRTLNAQFHLAVVDDSGNQSLIQIARRMRRLPRLYDPRLDPNHDVFQSIYTMERSRRSHAEHCEVFDAISNREGTRAEFLMREHVYRNRERVRCSLPVGNSGG